MNLMNGGAAAAAPEMLSIVEEAGRLWVAGCSEQERGWAPRHQRESWLCLMHAVAVLRVPLAFGRAQAEVTLSEDGAVATMTVADIGTVQSAASTMVMRSGRHCVQFTVVLDMYMYFGVVRPGWDVEGAANANNVDCFYFTANGQRWAHWPLGPSLDDWERM